ncbi:MAG: Gfo/Idh/MocA family protein [Sedimentisphaeraceae bacterium JB056]
MKKMRTAIVGLGRIGWYYHIPELLSHTDLFEFVCVCDPVDERLREAQTKYGVKTYSEYEQMLENEELDMVVIASPTKFHLEQTLKAFENGCDVFCEKPAVTEVEEMKTIIEESKKQCRKFMVYQPHRAGADIQCLKEILRQGILGDLFMIRRMRIDYTRRNDWQAFRKNGGGMLTNYGSHFVDQMLHLAGKNIEKIYYTERKVASLGDAEDVIRIFMETSEGLILDIDINMACAMPLQPWIVYGKYGTASLDFDGKHWNVRYCKPDELEDMTIQNTLAADNRSYENGENIKWYEQEFNVADYPAIDYYRNCYDYFTGFEKPLVPCDETLRLIEILCECRNQTL